MANDLHELDAIYPLSPSELHNQWLLTENADSIPAGWHHDAHGRWKLGSHPNSVKCELLTKAGERLGWVFSPALYLGPGGKAFFPEEALGLPVGRNPSWPEVERALYGRDRGGLSDGSGLEGLWAAVLFAGPEDKPEARVYLSPTNSIVFSPEKRIAATTSNLIPDRKRDLAVNKAFDPLGTNRYYAFGLTAFEGVKRLLPNHYGWMASRTGCVRAWRIRSTYAISNNASAAGTLQRVFFHQ